MQTMQVIYHFLYLGQWRGLSLSSTEKVRWIGKASFGLALALASACSSDKISVTSSRWKSVSLVSWIPSILLSSDERISQMGRGTMGGERMEMKRKTHRGIINYILI